ncbi:MAG: nuclear transport factor 2 family protein [Candidatus Bathyarchaeota archaeon]|nr:nuclear transport factor 2 family protein [Candidatus Bathyarchaeota archaeon]
MTEEDREAIKKVVEEAYIKGIHESQDRNKVESGFHQDFSMFVLGENDVEKVNVDEWFNRIAEMIKTNPELWKSKTTYNLRLMDVTRNAAMVKLDVFKGTTHFSTDYMLLYKFREGWKIVSKTFTVP